MGKAEPQKASNIIRFNCSVCRNNIIYIKVNNYKQNNAPFKANDFICTECNQGMMQTLVKTG